MSTDITYCDNCGSALDAEPACVELTHTLSCTLRRHYVSDLPLGVDSANAGESAVLCAACLAAVLAGDTSQLRRLTSS